MNTYGVIVYHQGMLARIHVNSKQVDNAFMLYHLHKHPHTHVHHQGMFAHIYVNSKQVDNAFMLCHLHKHPRTHVYE